MKKFYRREHLTAEDIKKNKSFMQNLAAGGLMSEDEFKVINFFWIFSNFLHFFEFFFAIKFVD